jgi:hypothetical protein
MYVNINKYYVIIIECLVLFNFIIECCLFFNNRLGFPNKIGGVVFSFIFVIFTMFGVLS